MLLESLLILSTTLSVVSAELLYTQCQQSNHIALTFDEGPSYSTGALLDTLQRLKLPATFHFTTRYLADPTIRQYIGKAIQHGHTVGLRGSDDWKLYSRSDQVITTTVRQAHEALVYYFPELESLQYLRLPYQAYDTRSLQLLASLGYIVTEHNLDSHDYDKYPTLDQSLSHILETVSHELSTKRGGKIIVFRDLQEQAAKSLAGIQKVAEKLGYRFVSMDQCLGRESKKITKPVKTASDYENSQTKSSYETSSSKSVYEETKTSSYEVTKTKAGYKPSKPTSYEDSSKTQSYQPTQAADYKPNKHINKPNKQSPVYNTYNTPNPQTFNSTISNTTVPTSNVTSVNTTQVNNTVSTNNTSTVINRNALPTNVAAEQVDYGTGSTIRTAMAPALLAVFIAFLFQ